METESETIELHHNEFDEEILQQPISFENIDPTNLPFSTMFKCARGSTGQVIHAFYDLSQNLLGVGNYINDKKEPTNEYQEYLYPKMAELASKIVSTYQEKFVIGVDDYLQKQVFGANLNGNRNNGQLNNFIPCKGINRFIRYKYVQVGQLLTLLNFRLTFICNRDPQFVKRYNENKEECIQFEELRKRAKEYCSYLKEEIFTEWLKCVSDAREHGKIEQKNIPVPVKLTADNVGVREIGSNRRQFFNKSQYEKFYNTHTTDQTPHHTTYRNRSQNFTSSNHMKVDNTNNQEI